MSYSLHLSGPAKKVLLRLDRRLQNRIVLRLDEILTDPFDPRISKWLKDAKGRRSSRVGGWRIIYMVDQESRSVNVSAFRPRGQAYSNP